MKFFTKKAFTLTELIVAITISVIVLIFTFQFVADIVNNLATTNKKSEVLDDLGEFNIMINNYKRAFPNVYILSDFPDQGGYDIIIMENIKWDTGLLLWVIDANTKKLIRNVSYPYYGKKVLWMRYLTEENLNDIGGSSDIIYDYSFYDDKIFEDLVIKDFQANIYNTWSILNIDTTILIYYNSGLDGIERKNISQNDMYKVNLDF